MDRSEPFVFFPQLCTHVSCTIDSRGRLRSAMVTSDRLLFFRDDRLCADTSLCGDGALRELRLCDFGDETRVAVVRSSGVWLVDVTAPAMHVTSRRVRIVPALASADHETVDAAFVTRTSLVILFSDEAVVVDVPSEDADDNIKSNYNGTSSSGNFAVQWRRWGSYRALAVCRASLHLAFALRRSSVIEVFPLKVRPKAADSVESPIFSPTYASPSLGAKSFETEEAAHKFSRRGVSASLGVYRVAAMAWHRARQHTILCVTCEHPTDGLRHIALFTMKSVPPLVPQIHDDCDEGSYGFGRCNEALQLIPVGNIDLGMTPPLAADIVPNLSRARIASSIDNCLEVFCVTSDGTTSIIRCRFGQHCQMGFVKEESGKMHGDRLLHPLIEHFGAISRIDVLPICKPRVVEFGVFTPQAERLLEGRQYRILTHFASGMVAVVMVDLLAPTVRIEAFLTLGSDNAPLRLAPGKGGGELGDLRILLGVARDRVFVLARQLCATEREQTRVVAIASIAPEHRGDFSTTTCAVDAVAKRSEGAVSTGEESVRKFMTVKCPEKMKMLPALLRACGGDAERLLTQLTAKYGSVDLNSPLSSPPGLVPEPETATAATTGVTREIYVEDVHAGPDGFFFATRVGGGARQQWRVPLDPLESFASAQAELFVHHAQLPSTAPIERAAFLETAASYQTGAYQHHSGKETIGKHHDDDDMSRGEVVYDGEIHCKRTDNGGVALCGATLPDSPLLSLHPFDAAVLLDVRAMRLASNCIVLAAIGAQLPDTAGHERILRLYGLSLLRDTRNGPCFALELELRGALSVFLCRDGDAFVLRQEGAAGDSCHAAVCASDSAVIERWVRCPVDGTDVHEWRRHNTTVSNLNEPDIMNAVDSADAAFHTDNGKALRATAMTVLPAPCDIESAGRALLVYTSSDGLCIRASGLSGSRGEMGDKDSGDGGAPCYHPVSLLLLLGMGRGAAVSHIAESLLAAMEDAANSGSTPGDASYASYESILAGEEKFNAVDCARELCRCVISGRLCEQPRVSDLTLHTSLSLSAPRKALTAPRTNPDADSFNGVVSALVLERLAAALPTARLAGLDSHAQFELLCVTDCLRAARAGGDAPAARFFFHYRMRQLRRRLSARGGPSALPAHAAALWAALSDAQLVILDELFGTAHALAWADVDAAHVPLWLGATHALRALAERVARAQYQSTRDVRECALMYCLSRKVGVLAALCRAERDTRLVAFFSRDFSDARHRQAAAANGFAAVRKNQPLFGAAFFVLAGDARSAAQVVLQRHKSACLALFVLRLAGDDGPADLEWFAEQRAREAAACGAVDAWEAACVAWRAGSPRRAIDAVARRPAANALDAVERVALLRYVARRGQRDREKRTPRRVLQWLMQAARLASGAGLRIPAALLYADAQVVLDSLRQGDEEHRGRREAKLKADSGLSDTVRKRATRFQADFNTGSLTFHGFDDDDDDASDGAGGNENRDDNRNKDTNARNDALSQGVSSHAHAPDSLAFASSSLSPAAAAAVAGTAVMEEAGGGDGDDDDDDGLLHSVTAATIQLEMRFAARWLQGRTDRTKSDDDACCKSALRAACQLTSTVGFRAPLVCVERDIAALARALHHKKQASDCKAPQPLPVLGDAHCVSRDAEEASSVTARVVIAATRLALVYVVEQNTDYALANAVLTFDSVESILRETREAAISMASAASYVRMVRETLCRVRDMVDERGSSGSLEILDPNLLPSLCSTSSPSDEAHLRSILLSWFAVFIHAQTIAELRDVAIIVRTGHVAHHAHLRWLLACTLSRATLRFDAAAAQLIARVISFRHLDDTLLSNPNGIFVEESQELRRGAQLLEANLCADLPPGFALNSAEHVLLDLSLSRAELFWQLPFIHSTPLSDEVAAAAALLPSATRPHASAHLLYGQLSDGAAATLRRAESAWLRWHHTHSGYRETLLARGLGRTRGTATTDRLVLHQAHHAVCSVGFDQSTCDSLVWGTDAGVVFVHGYREIIAGDNEAALVNEQTERRMAAAAFSAARGGRRCYVSEKSEKEHEGEKGAGSSEAATMLSRRPRSSIAAHSYVASHPHLPFFLARHGDDFVDLYSFTGTECAATFRCCKSYAVTDVSYSPNGHLFALGLADGSVAGWRFALSPARGGAPLFTHRLLPPGGVVAALFSGTNSSLLIVVGTDNAKKEKKEAARWKGDSASASEAGSGSGTLQRRVGVLLIVDLVIQEGQVIVRCELPFAPDFATYFSSLHSVLCVTNNARAAIYDMRSGRLFVIAPDAAPHVVVTCIAASRYDDLVALGTNDGHALLLRGSTLFAACAEMNQDNEIYTAGNVERKNDKGLLLNLAVSVQVAPTLSTRAGVRCLAFTPSVLLAGLADGKTVAAALVPMAVR